MSAPAIGTEGNIKINTGTTLDVTVTTTPAASLNWDAGDTKHAGQLANPSGATSWPFTWPLGSPPATYDCSTSPAWTPDAAAYEMTFQPFDSSGTPGDLRTQIVSIDRNIPYPVCAFAGGRNPQHGGVVDLQWRASFEGDVVSYSVYRSESTTSDTLVCADVPVNVTECTDEHPPAGTGPIAYYVRAKQSNWSFGTALGDPANRTIPAVGSPNSAPSAPGDVTLVAGTEPQITWTAAGDSAPGSVIFYRVYRDGQAIANRYARTSNAAGSSFSFTDKDATGTHTYYVSAVDDEFAESALVGAS